MVGLVRFELTTSCTPCKRATRLRYSPNRRRVRKLDASAGSKCFFRSFPAGLESASLHTAASLPVEKSLQPPRSRAGLGEVSFYPFP